MTVKSSIGKVVNTKTTSQDHHHHHHQTMGEVWVWLELNPDDKQNKYQ